MTGLVVLDLVIAWCAVSVIATVLWAVYDSRYDDGWFHE